MAEEERRAPPAGKVYLDMPVTYLKGVGPRRAESLRRLGIVTARDLLFHVPHRYEDASTVSPISSLEPGMDATVIGRVVSKGIIPTRKRLRIFQAVVRDDSGVIERTRKFTPCSLAQTFVLGFLNQSSLTAGLPCSDSRSRIKSPLRGS